MKFLKMREMPDLHQDPKFDYMVGRLVGTTEMLSFYMSLHGDDKMRGMASRAYDTLLFFFDPKEHSALPAPAAATPVSDGSENVTREMPAVR